MRIFHKKLFFLYLFFILTFAAHAQQFDPNLASKLQTKLDEIVVSYNIKGISASVIYPGEGMWQGVSGVSYDVVPITSDMEFGIGSNTKLFTAISVLRLVQRKTIKITDTIGEFLPPIPNVNAGITISQLLNHSSGIADLVKYPGYLDTITSNPNRFISAVENLKFIGPPIFLPGTRSAYSNSNYIVAGLIFEVVTGQKISKFIRDSLLIPLELDSTFFDVQETVLGTIAHPWNDGVDIDNTPRVSLNSSAWTTGAIYSNSNNMARWYDAIMNGQVLDYPTFEILTTFSANQGFGHGINKSTVNGRTVWGAGGAVLGYRSRMMFDTTSKAIICLLMNTHPLEITELSEDFLATLINNVSTGIYNNPNTLFQPKIFPNPANNSIYIDLNKQELIKIEIFNCLGELVATCFDTQIMISELEKGIYYVNIYTDKGSSMHKLVKV